MFDEVRNMNSRNSTPTARAMLTCGTKIWPATVSLVRLMSMRGSRPSCTACWVTEKAPVITAWLAMMVAAVVSRITGQ